MGLPHQFTKALAAAAANNVALSQSPGAGAILLNGSTSNRLSTTTAAASAAGTTILTLTSTAGVVAGQSVSDTTGNQIVAGTTVLGKTATTVTISQPIGNGGVGNGDTIVFAGTATLDTQRRVIITSGGNDTGINFTVNGAGDNGVPISDTFAGASGAAAQSNLDFLTVTSVTHTGSIAGTVTVGTNGVGSTPWFPLNWHAQPFNVEISGQVISGTANWGFQYTYQDPNNLPAAVAFPQAINDAVLQGQTGTLDGTINDPVAAVRLIINSGTGTVLGTIIEAGISGQ